MNIAHAAMATLAAATLVAATIGTTALIVIASIGSVAWAVALYQHQTQR